MHHATEYHTSISSLFDFQTYLASFEISKILPVDSELTDIGDRPDSHNSSFSNILTMCEDTGNATSKHSTPPVDIEKLFSVFTQQIASQIISQTNLLQDEIRNNELRIVQDNEDFKTEMNEEINELRCLIQAQQTSMTSNVPVAGSSSSSLVQTSSSLPLGNVPNSPSPVLSMSQNMVSNSLVPQASDIHSQMMLMMAESFSKLSMVLVETEYDSKFDWPKFSGETKIF
jgi:hypothetical protein